MLLHSFYFLQLFDFSCFLFLKTTYTKEFEKIFQSNINHVNKLEFLKTYK